MAKANADHVYLDTLDRIHLYAPTQYVDNGKAYEYVSNLSTQRRSTREVSPALAWCWIWERRLGLHSPIHLPGPSIQLNKADGYMHHMLVKAPT